MGRPPCSEKKGVKKGPWTPEDDIISVPYIQEHGPGNRRAVPTNTGLLRCSKSCRIRWTDYLRPGIKRGKFTDQDYPTHENLEFRSYVGVTVDSYEKPNNKKQNSIINANKNLSKYHN